MSELSGKQEGSHSTLDSNLASHQAASGSILSIPEDPFLTESFLLDVAQIN